MREKNISGRIFDLTNIIFLCLLCFLTVYPFIYVFSSSVSEAVYVESGLITLLPKGFTLRAYERVIQSRMIWTGFFNSVFYSIFQTGFDVTLVYLMAYPLSRRYFPMKNFFLIYLTVTMFFKGGLIPQYMVASWLGIVNTRWAMILMQAAPFMSILLVRNYLRTIPEEVVESATIDGASEPRILFRIMMPLSLPILATITLFSLVNTWNVFMRALIYLQDSRMHPIQVVLYRLLILSQTDDLMEEMVRAGMEDRIPLASVKYAVVIVALIPIITIYPFLQKYFVKGIIIGAIKG